MLKAKFKVKEWFVHYDEENDYEERNEKTKYFGFGCYEQACAYYQERVDTMMQQHTPSEAFEEHDYYLPEFCDHYCDFSIGDDDWAGIELIVIVTKENP